MRSDTSETKLDEMLKISTSRLIAADSEVADVKLVSLGVTTTTFSVLGVSGVMDFKRASNLDIVCCCKDCSDEICSITPKASCGVDDGDSVVLTVVLTVVEPL